MDLRVAEIGPAELAGFDPEGRMLSNVNTPHDYRQACSRAPRSVTPGIRTAAFVSVKPGFSFRHTGVNPLLQQSLATDSPHGPKGRFLR